MRRTLREKEPTRPSTLLNTLSADQLTVTARYQGLEAPKLINLVRGDLDWIVLKCLEKDRARRYETANALLMDVQRHLGNEPVTARPRSRLYDFQKTLRRHKVGFAAAGAVMVALFLGLGIATWSLVKEKRARERADIEAAKSFQIARFLEDMLRGIDPKTARERDTTLLRDILKNTSARFSQDLTNQPMVEAHIANTLGNIYAALGEFESAEQMARNALVLRRSDGNGESADVAESHFDLAHHLWSQGKLEEAEKVARDGLRFATDVEGKKDSLVAKSLAQLGVIVQDQGQLEEAEKLFRKSLTVRKQFLGSKHPTVAYALNSLSGVLTLEGKQTEAEQINREALITFGWNKSGRVPDDDSLYSRGLDFFDKGSLAEAEACFRHALEIRRKTRYDVDVAMSALANTLRRQQKFSEAEPLYRECLAMREKICPNAWYTFFTRVRLGATLMARRNYVEAEPLLISGYEGMRQRDSGIRERYTVLTESIEYLVQLFEATSRFEKAAEWRTKLTVIQADGPKGNPTWPRFSGDEQVSIER
jgi:tetratricopeptide (TPR) repeat protein